MPEAVIVIGNSSYELEKVLPNQIELELFLQDPV